MEPFDNNCNIWYRAFHGTANAEITEGLNDIDAIVNIYNNGFYKAKTIAFARGICCSDQWQWIENSRFVKKHQFKTKYNGIQTFKIMLQVAINPKGIHKQGMVWTALNSQFIRAYRILVKHIQR